MTDPTAIPGTAAVLLDLARPDLSSWTLTDLVVLVVLVLAVAGVVRRGGGLLAGAATLVTTGLAAWLVVSALATWAPPSVAAAARDSALLGVAPAPTHALQQADRLLHEGP